MLSREDLGKLGTGARYKGILVKIVYIDLSLTMDFTE